MVHTPNNSHNHIMHPNSNGIFSAVISPGSVPILKMPRNSTQGRIIDSVDNRNPTLSKFDFSLHQPPKIPWGGLSGRP